jgi:hypothetical protein
VQVYYLNIFAMSLDGLARLQKLKNLSTSASALKEAEPKKEEAQTAPVQTKEDLLARINSFANGFDDEQEESDEEDEDEDGYYDGDSNAESKGGGRELLDTKLDLSSVGSVGDAATANNMYPARTVAGALSRGDDGDKSSNNPEPIRIRSVGDVLKGYRERQKASEKQVEARHARRVAAKAASYNYAGSSVIDGAPGKKTTKRRKKKKEALDEKNSLDYLDEERNYGDDDGDDDEGGGGGPVLLSNLRYTEFSSNYRMRGDMMKQCESILAGGTTLVLRTQPGEDALDAKMMLRTIATELAPHTKSEYMLPEIFYDDASGTTEMHLESRTPP